MAVLAILALIAIPRFTAFRQDAIESRDFANASIIYRASAAYYAAEGNLDDFDISAYIDQEVQYTGGEVDETTGSITPVVVNGQVYPGP